MYFWVIQFFVGVMPLLNFYLIVTRDEKCLIGVNNLFWDGWLNLEMGVLLFLFIIYFLCLIDWNKHQDEPKSVAKTIETKEELRLLKDLSMSREKIENSKEKLNDSYQKLVLALSGGAIALAITFLGNFFSNNLVSNSIRIQCEKIFLMSLLFLTASLLFVLAGIFCGLRARKKGMSQIEASQFDLDKKHLKDFGGKWNFGASFTHNVSFFYCIFGIFLLILFVYFNIPTIRPN